MRRSAAVVFAAGLLAGCLDTVAVDTAPPRPRLEYVKVEPAFGETGRLFVAWSHPAGPNALHGQPGVVRVTSRVDGVVRTEDLTTPFDTRELPNGAVELEYRRGRGAVELRITQFDSGGRQTTVECFAPGWNCIFVVT